MKSFTRLALVVVGIGAATVLEGTRPASAQGKEARGSVTAVSDSSLTVHAGATDLAFVVNADTVVEVKAAAKESRKAGTANNRGITITQYIKTGNAVRVRYHEANGQNVAESVQPVNNAGDGGGSTQGESPRTVNGKVKSISASQVTVDNDGHESTFAVTRDTDVIAKGASKTTSAAGGKTVITDFVHSGDTVIVTYKESGGVMTASAVQLRISSK